ncbi:MAG: cupredoxin domain-containing protein [Acidimicrobiales bacterium]
MTTTDQPGRTAATPTDPRRSWIRLLVWAVAVSAGVDLAVMALLGEVIPPVAAGAVISFVGIALLGRWPGAGIRLLVAVSALLVLTSAPFALPLVGHPESAVGFGQAVIHLGGRLVAIAAAVGAWRHGSPVIARRLGRLAAGLLAATVIIGVVGTALTTSDTPAHGDVRVAVSDFEFPAEVRVASGSSVFVENGDVIRHTFSVEGADLSRELPAGTGVRLRIALDPGTYRLFCNVPGHGSMEGALVVY